MDVVSRIFGGRSSVPVPPPPPRPPQALNPSFPAPWAWLGEDRASPREDAKLPRGRSFHACAPKVLQAAKGCFLGFREVRSSIGSFRGLWAFN